MVPEIAELITTVNLKSIANQDFYRCLKLCFRQEEVDVYEVPGPNVRIDTHRQIGQALQKNGLDSNIVQQASGDLELIQDVPVSFVIQILHGSQEVGNIPGN
jgi:hypothetical protein